MPSSSTPQPGQLWPRWRFQAAQPPWTITTSFRAVPATCSTPRSRPPGRSGCASTPAAARWTSAALVAGCRRTKPSRTQTRSSQLQPPPPIAITAPATAPPLDRYPDPPSTALLQRAGAPCPPFPVSAHLRGESGVLAGTRRVRLHTHLAETVEEERFCHERFGCTPAEYLDRLGWLADDVWLAHCVHLEPDAVARFAATGTGVAHCPSSNSRLGAGIAPVADLLAVGSPVGLGVDGAASNESGQLLPGLRQARPPPR